MAFGSSMDIAAIQADSPRDLDYNSELVTVGLSNLLTAGAGVGFTGARFGLLLVCLAHPLTQPTTSVDSPVPVPCTLRLLTGPGLRPLTTAMQHKLLQGATSSL